MEHRLKMEELNKESLLKLEEYVKMKKHLKEEDHQKVHKAKEEWQTAWSKLREALMILERIEI